LTEIIFICVLVMLSSGCGRKLFPKPSGGETAPQVHDLHAQVMSQGVDLSWPVPTGESARDLRYSILKSEMKWENRNCPECPGVSQQQEAQFLDAASAEKAVSPSDHKIHWIDPNVAAHHAYRYQVALQDAKGSPVSLSNAAVAKIFPGPAAPVNITAAPQPQGILIQWKPVTKDVEGHELRGDLSFRIERLVQNKGWEKASPADVKGNSYLDQSIASEQNYSYRVISVLVVENTPIFGEPSSVALARAPEAVLPPPPMVVTACAVDVELNTCAVVKTIPTVADPFVPDGVYGGRFPVPSVLI
jgi:hypothetical protein